MAAAALRFERADCVDAAEPMSLALDHVGHLEQAHVGDDLVIFFVNKWRGARFPKRSEPCGFAPPGSDPREPGLEECKDAIGELWILGVAASEVGDRHRRQGNSCRVFVR